MRKSSAIAALFEKLGEGDPLTWTVVGVFLAGAAALGLYVLKVKFDLAREDRERAERYGRRPKR